MPPVRSPTITRPSCSLQMGYFYSTLSLQLVRESACMMQVDGKVPRRGVESWVHEFELTQRCYSCPIGPSRCDSNSTYPQKIEHRSCSGPGQSRWPTVTQVPGVRQRFRVLVMTRYCAASVGGRARRLQSLHLRFAHERRVFCEVPQATQSTARRVLALFYPNRTDKPQVSTRGTKRVICMIHGVGLVPRPILHLEFHREHIH